MWILFAFLFTLSQGLEDENNCGDGFRTCQSASEPPAGFPINAEQLNQVCKIIIEHLTCLTKVEETCDSDYHTPGYYRNSLEAMSEICDEDSSLNKALGENLACYKSSFQNYNMSCSALVKDMQLTAYDKIDDDFEEYRKSFCLAQATEMACLITKIGDKCGEFAENAAYEVVDLLKESIYNCNDVSVQELKAMADVIEIEEEVKSRLKTLLLILE